MTTDTEDLPLYAIALTMCDQAMNGFTNIGGAAWFTEAEQRAAWAEIPALPEGSESMFSADLKDPDGDVLEEKLVSAETCELLMGEPIARLIEDGRANTCYTAREMFARDPSLRDKYPALAGAAS
ncbi:hypothetical protein [Cupriavidus pauculus]|uniref:hypothetical protein n=1 Tax=Cupriavidus pauculus TaxID=82633 RepID=UPI001D0C8798|nr:hypothetical protein [Cupriavidus pauculus]